MAVQRPGTCFQHQLLQEARPDLQAGYEVLFPQHPGNPPDSGQSLWVHSVLTPCLSPSWNLSLLGTGSR